MPRPALVPFLTAATLLLVVVAYRAQYPARPAPPSANLDSPAGLQATTDVLTPADSFRDSVPRDQVDPNLLCDPYTEPGFLVSQPASLPLLLTTTDGLITW